MALLESKMNNGWVVDNGVNTYNSINLIATILFQNSDQVPKFGSASTLF